MTAKRWRALGSRLAVVIVLACACGLVGLLVGRAQRIGSAQAATAQSDASTAAFRQAETAGYPAAWRAGYHAGWAHGSALGSARGRRAGLAVARVRTVHQAAGALFLTAARSALSVAFASVPAEAAKRTVKCVEVGGGLCEVLGPALTHRPCPDGSVPDPATARVCVPAVLIEVEQRAAQATAAGTPGP